MKRSPYYPTLSLILMFRLLSKIPRVTADASGLTEATRCNEAVQVVSTVECGPGWI